MFLHTLTQTNKPLIEAAFALHREGVILPDTYIIDLDAFEANARRMKSTADSLGLDLYFMSKQMGRNPHLCKILAQMGYPGAVVVDYREADIMMENHIPIAHSGHLVQIPDAFLPKLLRYGSDLITVYSTKKAERINQICKEIGLKQNICLRVVREGDITYPGQDGGVVLEALPDFISSLEKMEHIRLTALTSFPCFIYSNESRCVEATSNLQTVLQAKKIAENLLGKKLHINLPSCTQNGLIGELAKLGGNSAEPGSAFIGTIPNNVTGNADEMLAIAYVSEISHNFKNNAYCYGGGFYPRGQIDSALVGTTLDEAKQMSAKGVPAENIDYTMALKGKAEVGNTVVMCFRPQIFTGRSYVALLKGVQTRKAKVVGLYDSMGRLYE